MNQLVNSALLAYYSRLEKANSKGQPRDGGSMRSYDTMSELERRELNQMLSDFQQCKPVSADVEEPDGNVLRIRSQSESDGESHA